MKNMKIEINAEQPLDEVVGELVSRGYKLKFETGVKKRRTVVTWKSGEYCVYGQRSHVIFPHEGLTTLAELKEM